MKPPSLIRVARSSEPTTSAPASSASLAFSPAAKTATRRVLPVPFGSIRVPRTIWSARLGSTFRWTCASTLSSNLAPSRSFRISRASRGEYLCSGSIFAFCSSNFLPINRNPHAPGRTFDYLRRAFYVGGVQVRHLGPGNLLHLRAAHRADLRAVRLAAALVQPRGLLQEERGGRRLGYKGERAVLVDRDLDRDDLAHLVARGIVELPDELPDVHLRLPESRPDGRRGVGLTAGDLQLQLARYAAPASSTHKNPLVCLELGYLVEGELHRRLDLLARLDPARVQEPLDLGAAQSERLLPGTYDLGDAWRLAHELPGRVVHVHVYEDVAGELALDGRHLLAVLDLDDVLRRDPDLSEVPVQTHRVDPSLQGRAHLVLVPRVCVYYVPLLQNVMLLVPTNAYRKIKRARRPNTKSQAATYAASTSTMMRTTAVLCLSCSRLGQLTRLSS